MKLEEKVIKNYGKYINWFDIVVWIRIRCDFWKGNVKGFFN